MTAAWDVLAAPREAGGRSLAELLAALGDAEGRLARGEGGVGIERVALDSRRVRPGDLFVAVPGTARDGLAFAADAVAAGAVAVAVAEGRPLPDLAVPLVVSRDPRRFAGLAAAELAGRPSEAMTLVGTTGTAGKTTVTWLCESIARHAGAATGLLGTIEHRIGGRRVPADLTTPDAVTLQDLLGEMRRAGVTHVFLEVSSHALALERLAGTALAVGVYTSLSRDHLDYHGDLAAYAEAKARLFHEVLPASSRGAFAVLNAEDPGVMEVAAATPLPVVRFGGEGDVCAEEVVFHRAGLRAVLRLGGERVPVESSLIGAPQLANILAAAAVAWRLGFSTEAIATGIRSLRRVPGRLDRVEAGQPFDVLVDYAHKPDALERVLVALRGLARRRLVVVFGCGGERDRGKRPQMGEIATRLADVTIVTSDNPRGEDPLAIIEEIMAGAGRTSCASVACAALGSESRGVVAVEPERRAAIARAIEIAEAGDLVVIAGKGHEDYQLVGAEKRAFDDRGEVCRALEGRGFAADGTEAGQ